MSACTSALHQGVCLRVASEPSHCATRRGQVKAAAAVDGRLVPLHRSSHETVSVRAMNEIEKWRPSDHCRLMIKVTVNASDT